MRDRAMTQANREVFNQRFSCSKAFLPHGNDMRPIAHAHMTTKGAGRADVIQRSAVESAGHDAETPHAADDS